MNFTCIDLLAAKPDRCRAISERFVQPSRWPLRLASVRAFAAPAMWLPSWI